MQSTPTILVGKSADTAEVVQMSLTDTAAVTAAIAAASSRAYPRSAAARLGRRRSAAAISTSASVEVVRETGHGSAAPTRCSPSGGQQATTSDQLRSSPPTITDPLLARSPREQPLARLLDAEAVRDSPSCSSTSTLSGNADDVSRAGGSR